MNKTIKDLLLDDYSLDPIVLEDENKNLINFEKVYVTNIDDCIYCVLHMENDSDENLFICRLEGEDNLILIDDDDIIDTIFENYQEENVIEDEIDELKDIDLYMNLFNLNYNENITLYNQFNEVNTYKRVHIAIFDGKTYFLLIPINEKDFNNVLVLYANHEEEDLDIVLDDDIIESCINDYKKALNEK